MARIGELPPHEAYLVDEDSAGWHFVPPASSMMPLKEALLAVNVRTASHLGLQLSSGQQGFYLVFPAP